MSNIYKGPDALEININKCDIILLILVIKHIIFNVIFKLGLSQK